eukprot:14211397-Alexandrium_andersonii.AAC.1
MSESNVRAVSTDTYTMATAAAAASVTTRMAQNGGVKETPLETSESWKAGRTKSSVPGPAKARAVSYTHLTLPTICSV